MNSQSLVGERYTMEHAGIAKIAALLEEFDAISIEDLERKAQKAAEELPVMWAFKTARGALFQYNIAGYPSDDFSGRDDYYTVENLRRHVEDREFKQAQDTFNSSR